jgi:hypothetical protein
VTEIPFEFRVQGIQGKVRTARYSLVPQRGGREAQGPVSQPPWQPVYETYHGVYVNVCYLITVDCDRGVMKKSLHREIEFIVEVPVGIVVSCRDGGAWQAARQSSS